MIKISKIHRIRNYCPLFLLNQNIFDTSRIQTKSFLMLAENKSKLSRIALFHIKSRVYIIYFVHDCLWKQYSACNLPRAPSKLIFGTILVTIRLFTHVQLKIREVNRQKRAKFFLTWITILPIFSLRSTISI